MFLNDAITGQPIAECQVPAGFAVQATINGTIQSFGRPYSATVELLREDQRGMLFFHSGECFHQIKFGQGERHVEGAYDPRTMLPLASFRKEDAYLDRLALFYNDGEPVKLYAKENVSDYMPEPALVEELRRSQVRLGELCAPGIVVDIQNVYAGATLRAYLLERNGAVMTLVLAAEVTATEYCLREAVDGMYARRVVTPIDGENLGIGMTAATLRRVCGPFGGAKTAGAKAAYIDWEARKVFGYLLAGEPDMERVRELQEWISGFRADDELYENMHRSVSELTPSLVHEQNELYQEQRKRTRDSRLNIIRNAV